MGIRVSAQVDGSMQFAKNMEKLDSDIRRFGYAEILYQWGQIMLKELLARVPEGETGLLKSQMQAFEPRIWSAGDGGDITVGTESEAYQGQTFYASMVEYGHGIGKRGSAVIRGQRANRKLGITRQATIDIRERVEPSPYMRPAVDAARPQLMPSAVKSLERVIAASVGNAGGT